MNSQFSHRSLLSRGGHLGTGSFLAAWWMALFLVVFPAPVRSDQTGPADSSDRVVLAQEITDLVRQGRRAEALPLCRVFTDRFPDDPVMLYNLACLENTADQAEEAVAAFTRAVAAGFDDFSLAFSDPDLASLKFHPDMIQLSLDHQLRLSALAVGRAVTLSWQEPSPPIHLFEAYSADSTGAPTVNLTWTPVGLDIELNAAGPWADLADPDNLAPWNGGPGLVVTLGIPSPGDPDTHLTANHFLFAFGMEKSTSQGALFLAGQERWQTVAEMQPKIRLDGSDNLELRGTIPWALILPYNPLVDDLLGFNATVRLTGQDGPSKVSVLPDPAAFRPRSDQRRVVPLNFRTASVGEEIFTGKLSSTISGSDPVSFDLVAVSPTEGTARLTIDFLGGPSQSLLPAGQVSGTLDLTAGLNRLTRQADFTALKTGPYFIKAEMKFPSGRTLSWGSTVLHLAPGWREEYLDRIEEVEPKEKPTALFHLQAIDEALALQGPRRGPEAIATTLAELDRLLANLATGGSILPSGGTFLAVYPGPDDQPRLCHIYLPVEWKIASRLNPVLTLSAVPDMTGALAGRMGQIYEKGRQKATLKTLDKAGFPIYLVPRLAPRDSKRPGDLAAEAAACLAWAQDFFQTPEVSVAGIDQGGGTALALASNHPETIKAMIIFAGQNLEPWPQADAAFVQRQLSNFPGSLPVTWVNFSRETEIAGQGPLIFEVLRDLKSNLAEVQEVRGGLNFTQAADRTVLWAEGLR